jgi:undecaprenyl-diphosphatase
MLIKSIILGLIQGLTEFLPISSSGHLVIFESFLEMETQGVIWEITLHFSTLLAIFAVFYKDIFMILKSVCLSCKKLFSGESIINVFKNDPHTRIFLLIIIGTIPTVIIAFSFRNAFESLFNKPGIAGYMLIVTGTMLWFTKYNFRTSSNKKNLVVLDALIIGTVQGLAITPGISRSGTTIATATFRGVDRETAARFSFLLVIPAILGAMDSQKRRNFFSHNRECCCRDNQLHFPTRLNKNSQ